MLPIKMAEFIFLKYGDTYRTKQNKRANGITQADFDALFAAIAHFYLRDI